MVTSALLCAPAALRADTVPEKARELADRGRAYHARGDYQKAIDAFTQAYAIAPSPALLFNLAQAHRLQGNCEAAARLYRRYLATNASAEERALAETHLATVERCAKDPARHLPVQIVGTFVVPALPGALDDTAVAPPRAAPVEHGSGARTAGMGLVVAGGAALAVATYYAVLAHDAEDEVTRAYAQGTNWTYIAPVDARGRSAATKARLIGAGGALGLASGIVLYVLGRHTGRTPVAVTPRGHGVEVSTQWTF